MARPQPAEARADILNDIAGFANSTTTPFFVVNGGDSMNVTGADDPKHAWGSEEQKLWDARAGRRPAGTDADNPGFYWRSGHYAAVFDVDSANQSIKPTLTPTNDTTRSWAREGYAMKENSVAIWTEYATSAVVLYWRIRTNDVVEFWAGGTKIATDDSSPAGPTVYRFPKMTLASRTWEMRAKTANGTSFSGMGFHINTETSGAWIWPMAKHGSKTAEFTLEGPNASYPAGLCLDFLRILKPQILRVRWVTNDITAYDPATYRQHLENFGTLAWSKYSDMIIVPEAPQARHPVSIPNKAAWSLYVDQQYDFAADHERVLVTPISDGTKTSTDLKPELTVNWNLDPKKFYWDATHHNTKGQRDDASYSFNWLNKVYDGGDSNPGNPGTGPGTTPTTTTLVVSSAAPAVGDLVTLTATVSPTAAGTMQFKDGTTNIGSAVAVSNGRAVTTTRDLTVGDHKVTAVFTPTDTTAYTGSTSGVTTVTIKPASTTPPSDATGPTVTLVSLTTGGGSVIDATHPYDPTFTVTDTSGVGGGVALTGPATGLGSFVNTTGNTWKLPAPIDYRDDVLQKGGPNGAIASGTRVGFYDKAAAINKTFTETYPMTVAAAPTVDTTKPVFANLTPAGSPALSADTAFEADITHSSGITAGTVGLVVNGTSYGAATLVSGTRYRKTLTLAQLSQLTDDTAALSGGVTPTKVFNAYFVAKANNGQTDRSADIPFTVNINTTVATAPTITPTAPESGDELDGNTVVTATIVETGFGIGGVWMTDPNKVKIIDLASAGGNAFNGAVQASDLSIDGYRIAASAAPPYDSVIAYSGVIPVTIKRVDALPRLAVIGKDDRINSPATLAKQKRDYVEVGDEFLNLKLPSTQERLGFDPTQGADNTDALDRFAKNVLGASAGRGILPPGKIYAKRILFDVSKTPDYPVQPDSGEPYGFAGPVIDGQGPMSTILCQLPGYTGSFLTLQGKIGTEAGPGNNNKLQSAHLSNFSLQGSPGAGGHGLYLRSVSSSTFEHMTIRGFDGSGIFLDRQTLIRGATSPYVRAVDEYSYDNFFSRIKILSNKRWGVESTETNAVSAYFDMEVSSNLLGGYKLTASNTKILGHIFGNGTAPVGGVYSGRGILLVPTTNPLSNASNVSILDVRFEGNSGPDGYEIEVRGTPSVILERYQLLANSGANWLGVGLDNSYAPTTSLKIGPGGGRVRTAGVTAIPNQKAFVLGPQSLATEFLAYPGIENTANGPTDLPGLLTDNGVNTILPPHTEYKPDGTPVIVIGH